MTVLYPAARWNDAVVYLDQIKKTFREKYEKRLKRADLLSTGKPAVRTGCLVVGVFAGLGFIGAMEKDVESDMLMWACMIATFALTYCLYSLLYQSFMKRLVSDMERFLLSSHVYWTRPPLEYLGEKDWIEVALKTFSLKYSRSLGNLEYLQMSEVVQVLYDGEYMCVHVILDGSALKELVFDCPDGLEDFKNAVEHEYILDMRYLDKYFFWMPTEEEKNKPFITIRF